MPISYYTLDIYLLKNYRHFVLRNVKSLNFDINTLLIITVPIMLVVYYT